MTEEEARIKAKIKEFEDIMGITPGREKRKLIREMKEEYEKDGSFTEYIDKAVWHNNSNPETEFNKIITQEYFKSIREGVNQ
jgi:hypothetical protein